jgi:6-phosphogluconolactonase
MKPETLVGDTTTLGHALVRDFEHRGRSAVAARGCFTTALPGGSVASKFFTHLAAAALDWSRTEFFWVDERAVPPSDPDSNYRLARVLWFEPAKVPEACIHRMPADDADLDRAASRYTQELRTIAGDPPRLDFVLLGVGPDGHVASIFPEQASSKNEDRPVIVVRDAPKPPSRRLTLTIPVLADANRLVVIALGHAKARAVHDALRDGNSVSPLALVIRQSRHPWVLLDPDAAAELTAQPSR